MNVTTPHHRLALLCTLAIGCHHAAAPARVARAEPRAESDAGRQLTWLLDVLARGGAVDKATIEAHFHPSFLAKVPAEQTITALQGLAGHLRGMTVVETRSTDDTHLLLRGKTPEARFALRLAVDAPTKLIAGLAVEPDIGPKPRTMAEAIERLRALAPRAQLLVADLDGGVCKPLHELNPKDPLAIASGFKLYVLLALVDRIIAGQASWDDAVPVRDDWKSLPSGVTQDDPAGTRVSIRTLAERMISISDNTATDHLLYTVGRKNVEAALRTAKHATPALDIPIMGTREIFWLKMAMSPDEVAAYLKLAPEPRRAFLEGLAGRHPTMEHMDEWKTARYVDRIEWFASSEDLCRVAGTLWSRAQTPKGAPLLDVLAKNPGIVAKTVKGLSYIGFKGGSEPGVMSATWLVRRDDGKWRVVTLALNGPNDFDEGAVIAIGNGIVELQAD